MTQDAFNSIERSYSKDVLEDIAWFGCASVAPSEHTYYYQTNAFFDLHQDEIVSYLVDCLGKDYLSQSLAENDNDIASWKNGLVWAFIELYANDLTVDSSVREAVTI
tara:strand:+ start:288 stop:608 length:321 start_codon:yes stop_codon:yes gene_type:complete